MPGNPLSGRQLCNCRLDDLTKCANNSAQVDVVPACRMRWAALSESKRMPKPGFLPLTAATALALAMMLPAAVRAAGLAAAPGGRIGRCHRVGIRRRGRGGAPDRDRRPGERRGGRTAGQGGRPRQRRPVAVAHRRPHRRPERRRQRRPGAGRRGRAGRGQPGIRPPAAAVPEAVHQPGRAGARRVGIQGHPGPGERPAGPGRRRPHPDRVACRARALCRRDRRTAGVAGRHGDAGPAAADAVRPVGAARHCVGAADGGLAAGRR